MNEDVLQYIWQTQSFTRTDLQTTAGENVVIYNPGQLNKGSGPDFSESRISIDKISWSGDIEIHSLASQWIAHKHDLDKNYDKVILHVVWQEDKKVTRSDGSRIPTIELKHYLSEGWQTRFQHLMNSLTAVPCESYLKSIDKMILTDTIHSALVYRLESKSNEVLKTLAISRGDWQQTALIWLFSGFGFKKNKDAFIELGNRVDPKIISKLSSSFQIEAYLFGLSGLLLDSDVGYVEKLRKEYQWLDKKYGFGDIEMSITWWKFMRMRPANFPTRRIAQLAILLFEGKGILRSILESEPEELIHMFDIKHSKFWQEHYHFNSKLGKTSIGLGKESRESLLINVVVVLLVAYGKYLNQPQYIEKAIQLLESMKPESNRIIRLWTGLGLAAESASESQGLIELFNNYCKKSRCLSCSIGRHILQSK